GEHEDEHEEGEHEDEHEEGEHDHHDHSGGDPHTWMIPSNVMTWTHNIAESLATLDPANAEAFEAGEEAYEAELAELEAYVQEQVALIDESARKIVTNHDAFGYFADRYGFEVIGTVIPSQSTMAEPSASDLADLIEVMEEEGVTVIFTETTVSDSLARTVADEIGSEVQVLVLFTGALGGPGSGAETYIDMIRFNVDQFVAGLAS
ncbi:MAG: zinc ABC transporter substrate-binding protein, partial [Chloroflexi bacterium]|nr:zinc ABC transporter substrate-binding protein [Chloroflexota bacterium]